MKPLLETGLESALAQPQVTPAPTAIQESIDNSSLNDVAPNLLLRTRSPAVMSPEPQVEESPSTLRRYRVTDEPAVGNLSPNFKKYIRDHFAKQREQQDRIKIFEGTPVPLGQFPECVGVGVPGKFDCSGVLIAEQLVLTAAHCGDRRKPTHVFFGSDVDKAQKVVKILKPIPHERYRSNIDGPKYMQSVYDLMLLILVDKQDCAPAKIAVSSQLDRKQFREVRVVGFGFTDQFNEIGAGTKRMGDVDVVSVDCAPPDNETYGGTSDLEFVAVDTSHGDKLQDACAGDSGGPAYILRNRAVQELAGIVSRTVKTAHSGAPCSEGAIYERVPEVVEWIRQKARENGVKPP